MTYLERGRICYGFAETEGFCAQPVPEGGTYWCDECGRRRDAEIAVRCEAIKAAAPPKYTEANLCADFSAAATAQGWTVYPETAGFDLLLTKDGLQLGIEAKLRPSLELLNQVAAHLDPHGSRTKGPHYVAALVPAYRGQWHSIAIALGIAVISPIDGLRRAGQWPSLDALIECLPPLHFTESVWLPPVVPDVPAGVAAPVKLTKWKWDALRLLARISIRGYITVADFRHIGLHASRWYAGRWVEPVGDGRWIKGKGQVLADDQHPAEFLVAIEREREVLLHFDAAQAKTRKPKTRGLFDDDTRAEMVANGCDDR